MALKTCRDKIKNNAIKKYDNLDLSKQDNNAENKKKSKLRKRKSWSQKAFYELDFYAEINKYKILLTAPSPERIAMGSYFNPNDVYSNFNLPFTVNPWDTYMPPVPNPGFTLPMLPAPIPLLTPPPPLPMLQPPPLLPNSDVLFTTYPPVLPYVADMLPTLEQFYDPVSSFAALTPVTLTDEEFNEIAEGIDEQLKHERVQSLDYYLTLPKKLFPSAKMPTLDPNPIIDDMCKIKDINRHAQWILDLEFGAPKVSTSRPIAVYDVQCNSIHCMNTQAVHPGFEGCSKEFKEVFLFYYDCLVSVWYRGYIRLTNDDCVTNFQTWLTPPMQSLGMCWT